MGKMRRRLRGLGSSAAASVALSFLDIVSAGFGGAVFLFVVFASLPIDTRAPAPGGGGRFIDVLVEWPRLAARGQKYAQANSGDNDTKNQIFPEVSEPLVDLHIVYESLRDGPYKIRLSSLAKGIDPKTDIHQTKPHEEKMPWDSIHVTGFDPFGRYERLDGSNDLHTMHVRVLKPRGGRWRFKAKVYSAGSVPSEDVARDSRSIEVDVTIHCLNRDDRVDGTTTLELPIEGYTPLSIEGPICEFEIRD